MRRLATLLMLALLLFNLAGYRMLFDYVQQRSNAMLEASLDKDEYNEEDLITLKIPLYIPYQNDHHNFERVSGTMHWKGKVYKYVKRKVVDNEVVLLCLPDKKSMQLEAARTEFFKSTNDISGDHTSKKESSSKHLIQLSVSDYDRTAMIEVRAMAVVSSGHSTTHLIFDLANAPGASPEQPPEMI